MDNKKIKNRNSINIISIGKNNNKIINVSSSINSRNIDYKKNNKSGQIVKNEPIEFDRMAHLTLGDLPEEEKAKISRLVEKLVSLGHEKDELVEKINDDKLLYEEEINEIKSDYSNKFEQLINKTNLYEKKSIDFQSNIDKYQYELLNKQKELDNYQSKISSSTTLLKLYQLKIKELDDKLKLIEKEKNMEIPNLDNHIKQMEELINSQTLTIKSSQESLEIMRSNYEQSETKVEELNDKLQYTSKNYSLIDSSYKKLELGCLDLTKQLTDKNKICLDKEQLCIQLENKLFLKDKHIKELENRLNSVNIYSEQVSLNDNLKYNNNNNNNNGKKILNKTDDCDDNSVDSERYSVNGDIFTPTPPQSPSIRRRNYNNENNNNNQFQDMFLNVSPRDNVSTSLYTSLSPSFIIKDAPKSSQKGIRKSSDNKLQNLSLSSPKIILSQSLEVESTESLTNLQQIYNKNDSNSDPRYSQEFVDNNDNNNNNNNNNTSNHISSPHVKIFATNKSTSMSPIYQNNTTIGSLPWEEMASKIDNTEYNYNKSIDNNQHELEIVKKKKNIKEKKIKNNEKSNRLRNSIDKKEEILIKRTNKIITNSKTNTRNLGPNPNGFFSFKKSELHESIDNFSNSKKTIAKINQRKGNENMKISLHQSVYAGINGDYDSILFDLLDDLNLDNNSI